MNVISGYTITKSIDPRAINHRFSSVHTMNNILMRKRKYLVLCQLFFAQLGALLLEILMLHSSQCGCWSVVDLRNSFLATVRIKIQIAMFRATIFRKSPFFRPQTNRAVWLGGGGKFEMLKGCMMVMMSTRQEKLGRDHWVDPGRSTFFKFLFTKNSKIKLTRILKLIQPWASRIELNWLEHRLYGTTSPTVPNHARRKPACYAVFLIKGMEKCNR